jgi:hypothetical protein
MFFNPIISITKKERRIGMKKILLKRYDDPHLIGVYRASKVVIALFALWVIATVPAPSIINTAAIITLIALIILTVISQPGNKKPEPGAEASPE